MSEPAGQSTVHGTRKRLAIWGLKALDRQKASSSVAFHGKEIGELSPGRISPEVAVDTGLRNLKTER